MPRVSNQISRVNEPSCFAEPLERGQFPHHIQVGERALHVDQVGRPVPEYPVGNMDGTAFRTPPCPGGGVRPGSWRWPRSWPGVAGFAEMNFRAGWEVADMIAGRLGMSAAVRAALRYTFERWERQGPDRRRGG
jgi:hypothetical protein